VIHIKKSTNLSIVYAILNFIILTRRAHSVDADKAPRSPCGQVLEEPTDRSRQPRVVDLDQVQEARRLSAEMQHDHGQTGEAEVIFKAAAGADRLT
jgi:hypothetical protein